MGKGRACLKRNSGNVLYLSAIVLAALLVNPFYSHCQPLPEICDNAVDDDGDGLIDLNDPDCECPEIAPISLIPNPSFEEMNCCPTDRSQLDCADNWIQASQATTDYINTCGWMGWPDFPPPLPFPDGNGIVGFRDGRFIQGVSEPGWKEYAGACLLSPLKTGTKYRFEFSLGFVDIRKSPPIEITFFGATDCMYLPFGSGNDFFGCPTNGPGWIRLGSSSEAGIGWVKADIEVTPSEDIYAIAIGPDCPNVITDRSLYYFFDNLVLAEQIAFAFQINPSNHPCDENFLLSVPTNTDFDYQWYLNGIALIGETDPELHSMYGEGDYQVMILGNNQCSVTKIFDHEIPSEFVMLSESICEGETYLFGNANLTQSNSYVDTFKTKFNCDSIVLLNLNVESGREVFREIKIFEGEKIRIGNNDYRKPGDYEVHLISGNGCDSLVQLHLEYYNVFFPNVFSPNDDGVNDTFNVHGNEELVGVLNLKIFNRWGGLIYDGKDFKPNGIAGWDGTINGQKVDTGLYVFLANLIMDDGIERMLSGEVILVR